MYLWLTELFEIELIFYIESEIMLNWIVWNGTVFAIKKTVYLY